MKIPKNGKLFDSSWRTNSTVEPCKVSDVAAFIDAHYLKKRPAIVMLALRILARGNCVGMVVFSAPPKETEKRYGGKCWELARLYLEDDIPKNAESWAISAAVRHIKRNHKNVCCLVSYADPSVGHTGTVYVASNWTPDGKTDEGRKTPRCDYIDAKTGKKYGRRGNVPKCAELVRVPRVSKNRYIMRLQ